MNMNIRHTASRIAFANDAALAGVTPQAETPAFDYSEQREFFEPADVAKAEERAQAIATNLKIKVIAFDQDWPEGAGAMILPLARNETRVVEKDGKKVEETGRKTHAIVVWPYFPPELVRNANGGESYIRSLVQSDQAASVLNPFRRQDWAKDSLDVSSCPVTLQDHIEGMRGDRGVIAPYFEACKVILPQLKEKSKAFAAFTPPYLRQLLQSAPMARQLAPKLEERGMFAIIIDKLEAYTKAKGGNVEIYQKWRDTRDQEAEVNLDDLNLDDLKTA